MYHWLTRPSRMSWDHPVFRFWHWLFQIQPQSAESSQLPLFLYRNKCPMFWFTVLLVLALPIFLCFRFVSFFLHAGVRRFEAHLVSKREAFSQLKRDDYEQWLLAYFRLFLQERQESLYILMDRSAFQDTPQWDGFAARQTWLLKEFVKLSSNLNPADKIYVLEHSQLFTVAAYDFDQKRLCWQARKDRLETLLQRVLPCLKNFLKRIFTVILGLVMLFGACLLIYTCYDLWLQGTFLTFILVFLSVLIFVSGGIYVFDRYMNQLSGFAWLLFWIGYYLTYPVHRLVFWLIGFTVAVYQNNCPSVVITYPEALRNESTRLG